MRSPRQRFPVSGLAISRTNRLLSSNFAYPVSGCALAVGDLPSATVPALDGGGWFTRAKGIENECGSLSLMAADREAISIVSGPLAIVWGVNAELRYSG
eukprot:5075058-Amphidinium_carterae.1